MKNVLTAKAALQISRTVNEVFEAVVDPEVMCNYFISKGSARLVQDTTVMWAFPEFEGEFPVRVGEVVNNEYLVLYWEHKDKEHKITMVFTPHNDTTVVKITEESEPVTDDGLEWVIGNTEGWAGFLLCMKAWLEYGVHLRKGAYDWRFDTQN